MANSLFPIIDLDENFSIGDEAMGSKTKCWVQLPGQGIWLFKFARANTGEAWSEKIAAEIADLLALPHAEVELGRFQGHLGSLSKRFPDLDRGAVELIHGNELLAGQLSHYDRYKSFKQQDHTLPNILKVVGRIFPNEDARCEALTRLSGYVVLDALILNTDRHHENWALLRESLENGYIRHSVAPTYDHASSLGRELLEVKLRAREQLPDPTAAYVNKARGAIFIGDSRHGANPIEIARLASHYDPQLVEPWIRRVETLTDYSFEHLFDRLPPGVLTQRARDFAISIMKYTRKVLCDFK